MLLGLARQIQHVKFLVNDNSTTILTGMGVAGVITTTYLTGRATFKAAKLIQEEEDKVAENLSEDLRREGYARVALSKTAKIKLVWHLYIPPGTTLVITVAAILVANKIANKKVAALTVASGISERALQEYKAKVVERLGDRQDQKIRDEVAQDRVNKHPVNAREVILAGTGEVLCFDMLTGRYFQSTMEEIKRAENKINHDLVNFMSASLSDFYDEIGLPPTSYTDSVGWNVNNRMEVQFTTVMSSDNRPCLAIDFVNPPIADYNRHYD
jgi:hypothetical protein